MLKILIAALVMSVIALIIGIFGLNGAFNHNPSLENLMHLICMVLGSIGLMLGAGITIGTAIGDII